MRASLTKWKADEAPPSGKPTARAGCLVPFGLLDGFAYTGTGLSAASAARRLARTTWDRLGARSEDEAYSCHVQRFRRDIGIATAREFARYRLLRVPFIGVPRAVVRDRHAGRREARAVPAQGPMQADFFRHQADIWQAVAA